MIRLVDQRNRELIEHGIAAAAARALAQIQAAAAIFQPEDADVSDNDVEDVTDNEEEDVAPQQLGFLADPNLTEDSEGEEELHEPNVVPAYLSFTEDEDEDTAPLRPVPTRLTSTKTVLLSLGSVLFLSSFFFIFFWSPDATIVTFFA